MANAERAIEKLYEDAGIRDELTDDEANILLRWAEDQVMRLADGADDATFEVRYDALRGLLKSINRFVGRRADLDAGAAAAKLSEMAQSATEIAAQPDVARLQTVAGQAASLDGAALLKAVTSLFKPGSTPAVQIAPIEPPSVETPVEPSTVHPPVETLPAVATPVEPAPPAEPDAPTTGNIYPGQTPFTPFRRPTTDEITTDGETQNDDFLFDL